MNTSADPTTVLDCGHVPTPDAGIGTGFAFGDGLRTMCYGCADSAQAAEMSATPAGEPFAAYTSMDGRNVTTWSGGVLARVTRRTDNGRQTYLRATDAAGGHWTGRGPSGTGMYVTLRRTA